MQLEILTNNIVIYYEIRGLNNILLHKLVFVNYFFPYESIILLIISFKQLFLPLYIDPRWIINSKLFKLKPMAREIN